MSIMALAWRVRPTQRPGVSHFHLGTGGRKQEFGNSGMGVDKVDSGDLNRCHFGPELNNAFCSSFSAVMVYRNT